MICLRGLTTSSEELKEAIVIDSYQSRWKCDLHLNCLCIPCKWPTLENEWQSTSETPLLIQATTCSICHEKGTWLCVHDGHMLCEKHVEIRKCHGSLHSPLSCPLAKKNSPLWPNPFAFMYRRGLTLQPGTQSADGKFKYSLNFHITVINFKGNLKITSWAHAKDKFPCRHFIPSSASIYLPAWRICIEPIQETFPTDLNKCRFNWSKAIIFILKQAKNASLKFPDYILKSHLEKNFLFLLKDEKAICIWCHTLYPTLELFALSKCSLFELNMLDNII